MSRAQTHEKRGADFGKDTTIDSDDDDDDDDEGNALEQQDTVVLPESSNGMDQPFTHDELSKAMTAATLTPPKSAGKSQD